MEYLSPPLTNNEKKGHSLSFQNLFNQFAIYQSNFHFDSFHVPSNLTGCNEDGNTLIQARSVDVFIEAIFPVSSAVHT